MGGVAPLYGVTLTLQSFLEEARVSKRRKTFISINSTTKCVHCRLQRVAYIRNNRYTHPSAVYIFVVRKHKFVAVVCSSYHRIFYCKGDEAPTTRVCGIIYTRPLALSCRVGYTLRFSVQEIFLFKNNMPTSLSHKRQKRDHSSPCYPSGRQAQRTNPAISIPPVPSIRSFTTMLIAGRHDIYCRFSRPPARLDGLRSSVTLQPFDVFSHVRGSHEVFFRDSLSDSPTTQNLSPRPGANRDT